MESIELPFAGFEGSVVGALEKNSDLVIAAETGAGKSTLIAGMLLRAGYGKRGMIGHTQPRRFATISVSRRVAELHRSGLGGIIGYQIRGDRKVTEKTLVKFMTEGILGRELHGDKRLRRYGVIVLDEAHERSVNMDILLALAKQVRRQRQDMKFIVMSATINEEHFAKHLNGAKIIRVPGRVFDVETRWAETTPYGTKGMIEAAIKKTTEIVASEKGDILVFMPDEESIKQVCKGLDDKVRGCRILSLYGQQAPEEQQRVFDRTGGRRIIVATNIAETSVTIDGVVHVVDSGMIKEMVYVNASMSALKVTEHSKAGCDQRKGRAGRTQPGVYHPLFTKESYDEREAYTKPEILRTALDQTLLHLRTLGYTMDEVKSFEFMDPPGESRWQEAEDRLKLLGALDADGNVTADGVIMERLPMAPVFGRILLTSAMYGCTARIATVVAGMTARNVFVRPREKEEFADAAHAAFRNPTSDALTLLNVWDAWNERVGQNGERLAWARENFLSSRALAEIDRNREQILGVFEREGIAVSEEQDPALIRKAVAAGLIVNLCVKRGRFEYEWHGQFAYIHPSSSVFSEKPEMMVATDIVETSKVFCRGCSSFDKKWLDELVPAACREVEFSVSRRPHDNRTIGIVRREKWLGTTIREESLSAPTEECMPDIAAFLVADACQRDGWHLQSNENYTRIRIITEACGINTFDIPNAFYSEGGATGSRSEYLAMMLAADVAGRIRGLASFDDVRRCNLLLSLEEFLSPDERDKAVRIKDEIETAELRRQEESKERNRQKEEEDAQREAKRQELRERCKRLGERVWSLSPRPFELQEESESIRDRIGYGWFLDNYDEQLNALERKIERAEEEQKKACVQSNELWDAILALHPTCPFCGGAWTEARMYLVCSGKHTRERLMKLEQTLVTSPLTIGVFKTDRDEWVGDLRFDTDGVRLRMAIARTEPWRGKKFSSVRYEPLFVILPESLSTEYPAILRDLEELRNLRMTVSRERETIKGLGANLVKLTFTVRDNDMVATDGRCTYRAAYQAFYPKKGETWYCRVKTSTEIAQSMKTVEAVHKVEYSDNDVAVFVELLKETYPGLPEELLRDG